MEVTQLRHVVAASREVSFAKAAEACFTSRQNISHSIHDLEDELGVTLFSRQGKGMALTPAGEIVAHRAGLILEQVDSLRHAFAKPTPDQQQLEIAISSNLFAGVSPGIVSIFDEHMERFLISEMCCEECYEKVCSEEVDAAFVCCMERQFPLCSVAEIGVSPAYAFMSAGSPLAKRARLMPSDFLEAKLVLMSDPASQYKPLLNLLDSMNFDPRNISLVPSMSSMIHLVKRSPSMAFVTERLAQVPPSETVAVTISDSRLDWHFYMIYPRASRNHAELNRLLKRMRGVLHANPHWL